MRRIHRSSCRIGRDVRSKKENLQNRDITPDNEDNDILAPSCFTPVDHKL